jgi:hypothetical protein
VVEMEAVPPLTVTGLPIGVGVPVPYSNWTEPSTSEVTVAFRVTEVPMACGLDWVVVSVVVVGSAVTVNGTAALVEGA